MYMFVPDAKTLQLAALAPVFSNVKSKIEILSIQF